MLQYMIPLVESILPLWNEYLIYIFALSFLTFVPSLIFSLFRS